MERCSLNNAVKALSEISSIMIEENEFEVSGRNATSQHKKLPLQDAG
jgi:hypothetical protein